MDDNQPASLLNKNGADWPALPWDEWKDTCETLQRWMQIVGKIRLAQTPFINHWWNVPLYVDARGLTTSPIPYKDTVFQINFDFIDQKLRVETGEGQKRSLELYPRTVADFYRSLMELLASISIEVAIWPVPVEIDDRTPFDQDQKHASYDGEYARRFWRILVQVDRVVKEFRSFYMGKASPVQFFWGSFDLSLSLYSGRKAPEHPGSPNVARYVMIEAYSREESAFGFWPGKGLGVPAFYAYAYPEPPGYPSYSIQPSEAYYSTDMGEYILPYQVVRSSSFPDETLMAFLRTTYEAAANLGSWDREVLERKVARER